MEYSARAILTGCIKPKVSRKVKSVAEIVIYNQFVHMTNNQQIIISALKYIGISTGINKYILFKSLNVSDSTCPFQASVDVCACASYPVINGLLNLHSIG